VRPYHHGQLREALLEAAERSLRAGGEDQLSLRELAREIGVSHAAPRRHFPDKQALLDALAVDGWARLDRQLRAVEPVAFLPRAQAAVAAYIAFATEHAALLELMYAVKHRPGADEVAAAAHPVFAFLGDVITRGQAEGELAPGDPERVGIILFALMQGIASLTNGNLVRPELLDGLVEAAVAQFVRGARP
jgi:AcrR family transcriptional regulator